MQVNPYSCIEIYAGHPVITGLYTKSQTLPCILRVIGTQGSLARSTLRNPECAGMSDLSLTSGQDPKLVKDSL